MLETNLTYPLVVEVTMYKHNWSDNKIISEIKKNARLNRVGSTDSHFFVSTKDLKEILANKFSEDILHQASLTTEKLAENITSAFFLHNVVNSFSNLRFVKFNLSSEKNYTRKQGKSINFDYKILHARINLPELVESTKELKDIRKLLFDMKFWKFNKFNPTTFIEISSRDLINQIHYHEGSDSEFVKEHAAVIGGLMNYIDIKLENDNSVIHLIIRE